MVYLAPVQEALRVEAMTKRRPERIPLRAVLSMRLLALFGHLREAAEWRPAGAVSRHLEI
jgi:hypothetical protein